MSETREEPAPWTWRMLVIATVVWSGYGFGASWIAEDAAILGYVHREGALHDWTGSQYGLELIHFWRPVVTTSWWLQESLFGPSAVALRALNVLTHVGCALFAAGIVARLGGGTRPMLVACLLVTEQPVEWPPFVQAVQDRCRFPFKIEQSSTSFPDSSR